ncbi:hypothetical protein vBAspABolek_07 [Aeromonas phage vB_AspA_Bolek]|nr:hypothetical protein vBAspABolek_07 [Aeromonas phage vB_AspA_Bolek]
MTIKVRRNTAVFKQVTRVLGVRRALRELKKVAAAPYSDFYQEARSVSSSFYWSQTPQGSTFWGKVSEFAYRRA